MQTNIEQVVSMIRALPLEDLDKLDKVINEEKQAKREKRRSPIGGLSDTKKHENGWMNTARNI